MEKPVATRRPASLPVSDESNAAVAIRRSRRPSSAHDGANSEEGGSLKEESAGEEEEVEEDQVSDADSVEEELERLVFGDSVGFTQSVRSLAQRRRNVEAAESDPEGEEQGTDGEENGLEGADDDDLFFLDTGPSKDGAALQSTTLEDGFDEEDEDGHAYGDRPAPAWEDSDDERVTVSLAAVPRLRKLRVREDEDIISGREYIGRLRAQYERLHPRPEWATTAVAAAAGVNGKRRRRRRSGDGSASSGESSAADEMDVDDDDAIDSTPPLAKLLRDAGALTARRSDTSARLRKLRPDVVDIQRTKDISGIQPSAVTSLSFHPTLPLLLSSGPSSTLYLHHVHAHPPDPNPLLTSLHIKHTPLTTTAFHPDPSDTRIFLSARRRYFHIWDLGRGSVDKVSRVYGHGHEQRSMERFALSPDGARIALLGSARKGAGVLNILDARTLQWTAQARVESRGGIADFQWWADGRGLCIAGKNGEVTEWSVARGGAVARWRDEGAVGTTVIALGCDGVGGGRRRRRGSVRKSGHDGGGDDEDDDGDDEKSLGGDRWVAIGSSSGIVNIYDRRPWRRQQQQQQRIPPDPKPTRTLDHLTTAISHLAFAPDDAGSSQLLVMASRWKRDALRLVHLPSCTVYRNWPTANTPLGRISAVAWGRAAEGGGDGGGGGGGELLLAVGNEQGKIRMWEVRG